MDSAIAFNILIVAFNIALLTWQVGRLVSLIEKIDQKRK
jgi:hypothetical protein